MAFVLLALALSCSDVAGQDSNPAPDTSLEFCEEPGDFMHLMMRISKAECGYYERCGVEIDSYYDCVVAMTNHTVPIYDVHQSGFCFDWCDGRELVERWETQGCDEFPWPSISQEAFYVCGETQWP